MCICINDIWGYCEHDYNYKTGNQLIFLLANCASQGGNLLLNVGPRPDGSIPGEQVARLEAMGKWLKTNGESIYGSERPERAMTGCGRVTAAGDAVYIHTLYWFGKQMRLQNARRLFSKANGDILHLKADLLATGQEIKADWDGDVLVLYNLPDTAPDKADTVIRLCGSNG